MTDGGEWIAMGWGMKWRGRGGHWDCRFFCLQVWMRREKSRMIPGRTTSSVWSSMIWNRLLKRTGREGEAEKREKLITLEKRDHWWSPDLEGPGPTTLYTPCLIICPDPQIPLLDGSSYRLCQAHCLSCGCAHSVLEEWMNDWVGCWVDIQHYKSVRKDASLCNLQEAKVQNVNSSNRIQGTLSNIMVFSE